MTQRKDQREVVHAYDYDKLGRLTQDRVTSLGRNGENVDGSVRRIGRTYEVRGMLGSVTSYDNSMVGQGTVLNEVVLTYNSFGQLVTEHQEHDGAKDANTLSVGYAYAPGSDGINPTNQIRPTKMIYPNGREVHYVYTDAGDASGISDVLNRITAISDAATRGLSDANVIASYQYIGAGTVIRKDYPTPDIRLDYWGGTSGTYAGFDRFGRITDQRWVDYSDPNNPADLFRIQYGYDRNSNRTYAEDLVYTGSSRVYGYDNLDRLVSDKTGPINATKTDIQSHWQRFGQEWTLDPLGNHLAVSDMATQSYVTNTPNKANEYVSRQVRADRNKGVMKDEFADAATASNWSLPAGSTDAFDINTTTSGSLTTTTVNADTYSTKTEDAARAIVLWGEPTGPGKVWASINFPGTATASDEAGIVFGYKGPNDYWLNLRTATNDSHHVYRVVDGVRTYVGQSHAGSAASRTGLNAQSVGTLNLIDGLPSGKIGVYSNLAGVHFSYFRYYDASRRVDLGDRWINFSGGTDPTHE